MTDLGTLGGDNSDAYAINASGEVVGTSATTGDAAYDAFLYTTSSGMIDLNSLLPAGSGWDLQVATAINDSGQVVGFGTNPEGQQDAFLMDTTPEPASMALFGASAALLVMMRKKLRRPDSAWHRLTSQASLRVAADIASPATISMVDSRRALARSMSLCDTLPIA
jgi:probable HAF family extracellular repeat protein